MDTQLSVLQRSGLDVETDERCHDVCPPSADVDTSTDLFSWRSKRKSISSVIPRGNIRRSIRRLVRHKPDQLAASAGSARDKDAGEKIKHSLSDTQINQRVRSESLPNPSNESNKPCESHSMSASVDTQPFSTSKLQTAQSMQNPLPSKCEQVVAAPECSCPTARPKMVVPKLFVSPESLRHSLLEYDVLFASSSSEGEEEEEDDDNSCNQLTMIRQQHALGLTFGQNMTGDSERGSSSREEGQGWSPPVLEMEVVPPEIEVVPLYCKHQEYDITVAVAVVVNLVHIVGKQPPNSMHRPMASFACFPFGWVYNRNVQRGLI